MARLGNWQTEYAQFLTDRLSMPYAWGTNDCCIFAADGIKAITGVDIAESFRGYTDEAGAVAAIDRVCGGTTAEDAVEYCSETFFFPLLSTVLLAQRGDLLLVQNGVKVIAGLVSMHGQAVCVTDEGLQPFPISLAIKAFRV